jgi:DNA-binding GntR family transcriptional regulator
MARVALENNFTMNSAVRDRLYEDIISGRLPPGKRLTINELCKRYRTSSTPVRSALLELQGRGLVTAQPHRGAMVRLIDREYLENLYDVRTAIISLIMPKVVKYVSNADIEAAEKLKQEFQRVAPTGDIPALLDARRAFYRFVFQIGRNPEALDVIERTWNIIDILRLRYGIDPSRIELSSSAHEQLLRALTKRDAEAALKAILSSNERTMRDLLTRMQASKTAAS